MTNQEKDRHVLAAAVKSGAQVIVTQNSKDFPSQALASYNIEVQSADDFLVNLFYLDKTTIKDILHEQAAVLRNPPRTIADLLGTLSQHAPSFVYLVSQSMHIKVYSWTPLQVGRKKQ